MAILCNHQRSVPKKHSEQMDKLKKLVEDLEEEKKNLKQRYRLAKAGKLPDDEEDPDDKNEEGAKKKAPPRDPARIKKAIEKLSERIKNKKVEIEQKDELKSIALGTSKINYMDPRITAAWCKKHDVRISSPVQKDCRRCPNPLGHRCPSRRSSRRRSGTNSRGPWTWTLISDTELSVSESTRFLVLRNILIPAKARVGVAGVAVSFVCVFRRLSFNG